MSRQHWPRDTILAAIRRFAALHDRPPAWRDFKDGQQGLPRPGTLYAHFATGRVEAVRAAGVACADQRPWHTGMEGLR